ncbi:MAG: hypothetical protein R2778_19360 [Saprospiraceae bacterium]
MLQLFRNIQFTTAITLAVYVVLSHWAALSGQLTANADMQDSGLLYTSLFGWLSKEAFWSALYACILVYIQALLANRLADEFRILADRSWLPGMAYALVVSALPDFQFFSAPLVAATFVILSLRKIFQTYKSPKSPVLVFDASLWMAVSCLFYPKALLLLIAVYLGIGIFRSWNFRDQIAFAAGVFVPLFLAWVGYFWFDMGGEFRAAQFGNLYGLFRFDMRTDAVFMIKAAILILIFLILMVNYGTFARVKAMQTQKCVSVLFWCLLVSALIVLLRPEWRWEAFALTAAPIGIFLGMAFQEMRSGLAELLHIIILGLIVLLQYPILAL